VAGSEHEVEEDHEVRGHELVVLPLGDAAFRGRLHLALALQAEEVPLGLHPLDLEGAVVADVGDLPEARGVRDPMMPTKKSSSMALSTSKSQWYPYASHSEPTTCSADRMG